MSLKEDAKEWWEIVGKTPLDVGAEMLGVINGKQPLTDKETWWCNDDVQEEVEAKKK